MDKDCSNSGDHGSGVMQHQEPSRKIFNTNDMCKWKNSEAYNEYKGFIIAINEAVKSKPKSANCFESPAIQAMINLLNEMDDWLKLYPPIDQPQRFGNKAFRSYYDRLRKDGKSLLRKYLPENLHNTVDEIAVYLIEGFGNSTRIDYGTGHELSFLWHISCLFKIGFFQREDQCAAALKVFDRYLTLVRKIQTTYRMEPAGSRGVWSLDDFQFMPFIWGSSQLVGNHKIEPASFYQPNVVSENCEDYLFIACIDYINKVKTGPFFEHSNQLFNLSGIDSWTKINQGLLKMYEKEVLSSYPVVQHILFGSLMPITKALQPADSQVLGAQKRQIRTPARPPPSVNSSLLPPPSPSH